MDMIETGKKIARLRREAGITQMALADKLNISFQAVSNWERGQTMPDIAKLYELSDIFEVSIDTILGNTRNAEILNAADTGVMPDETLTIDELAEVAPILKTKQADTLTENIIEKIEKEGKKMNLKELEKVLEYLSEDFIDEIVRKIYNQKGELKSLEPFLEWMYEDTISELAMSDYEKYGDTKRLECVIEYMNDDDINKICAKALAKDGFDQLGVLTEYIDSEVLEDYIRKNLEI